MAGLFQVTDKNGGASVDIYAVKPTVIGGISTAEFLAYDTASDSFKWFPSNNFEAAAGSGGIDPVIPIEGIALEGITGQVNLYVQQELEIQVLIIPDNATEKVINLSVENPNLVEIINIDSSTNKVTLKGISTGATVLRATTANGSGFDFRILVLNEIIYPTAINVLPNTVSINLGENGTCTAVVDPTNATSRQVTWDIVDTNILQQVDISANIFTFRGLNTGTTIVHARSNLDANIVGSCTVTVGNSSTASVHDYESLVEALGNPIITQINITDDIDLIDTIRINRQVTIEGGGHTVSYIEDEFKDGIIISANNVIVEDIAVYMANDDPGWEGHYGIHVYNSTGVTLRNILSTGEDGGILVNGSTVNTSGYINLSGNSFGGIELSTGSGLTRISSIEISSTNIINSTETAEHPTIWSDPYNGNYGTVIGGNLTAVEIDGQKKWYIDPANEPPILPQTLTADPTSLLMKIGDSADVTITFSPENTNRKDLTIYSVVQESFDIARRDENGKAIYNITFAREFTGSYNQIISFESPLNPAASVNIDFNWDAE